MTGAEQGTSSASGIPMLYRELASTGYFNHGTPRTSLCHAPLGDMDMPLLAQLGESDEGWYMHVYINLRDPDDTTPASPVFSLLNSCHALLFQTAQNTLNTTQQTAFVAAMGAIVSDELDRKKQKSTLQQLK